jgi:hypothetical protein
MSIAVERHSEHGSYPEKQAQNNITVLNERRRAALAEIDNAPFSHALSLSFSIPSDPSIAGSTSKSVW